MSLFVGEAGYVYAFEPQRVLFQMLCTNIQLNQRRNVIAYPDALSNTKSSLTWYVHPDSYLTESNFGDFPIKGNIRDEASFVAPGERDEAVLVNRLDDYGVKGRVTLIKISVPANMVLDVLLGAENIINVFDPYLYINPPDNEVEALNWLQAHKYVVWVQETKMFRHNNYKDSPVNQLNFSEKQWLCVPASKQQNNHVWDLLTRTRDNQSDIDESLYLTQKEFPEQPQPAEN
eukprot:c4049_g1_i1.p1 GENE.c4049_g1_i1~~c4049_g1_i1.p1  ORF type:complete len:232 (-),score=62.95 c4049_g1_i1:206-901(-)